MKERPLYLNISSEIRTRIESGEWGFGAMLPSEFQLSDEYNVSRGTVRQVLSKLEKEGFIRREQGKGTFISYQQSEDDVQNKLIGQSIYFIVPYVRDSFIPSILLGLESAARSKGYSVVFHHVENDEEKQVAALQKAVQQGAAGIVLYPVNSNSNNQILRDLVRRQFPLVTIDRYIRGLHSAYVISDNFGGGLIATQHLLSLGHRRIAFLSWVDPSTSMEHRRFGYRHALLEAGFEEDPELEWEVEGYPEIDHEAVKNLLLQTDRPTAIFAANDQLALTVQRMAHAVKINAPDDLAIVGFDNLDISVHLDTPLTTVAQPTFDMGHEAGELIFSQINKKTSCCQRRILPTQLIIRRSCGAETPDI